MFPPDQSRRARSGHGTPGSARRPGPVVAAAVLALALLAGAFAIGRTTADPGSAPRPVRSVAGPPVSKSTLSFAHGPTKFVSELPTGFTQDRAGALAAAAVATETLTDYVQSRRTTTPDAWMKTYTTGTLSNATVKRIWNVNPSIDPRAGDPNYRPTSFGPASNPGAPGVASSATRAVSLIVPLGYQTLSIAPSSAHVKIWLSGQSWAQGATRPQAVLYVMFDVTMAWAGGDWKITNLVNPAGVDWPGDTPEGKGAAGYSPWPGGQFTFLTG